MFNPLNLISKFIKSGNQKELDRIGKIVEKINLHEEDFKNLNDDDFPKKTNGFKNHIKDGKTLDELLPEAFALVREAAKRTRNERHFNVQLIGGVALQEGKIAENRVSVDFPAILAQLGQDIFNGKGWDKLDSKPPKNSSLSFA